MSKRRSRMDRYRVYWENPPGPGSGLTIEVEDHRGRKWSSEFSGRALLTVEEAGAVLRVYRATAYRWIESGKLRAVEYHGHMMVPLSEVKRKLKLRLRRE